MSLALNVYRPRAARILRRAMRYLPLDGGYTLSLNVGDTRFVTPVVNGICNEGPDTALLQLYAKVLPSRAGTFLDIGANVGQTLLAVRAANPGMPYVGLEPNVTCSAYMRSLIKHNGIRGATVLPVAIVDQPGFMELQLFYDNEADSSASLVSGIRPEQRIASTLHVPCYTWLQISKVLEDDPVGFVKIDVEGAELEVLRTIESLLQTQRPWMLMEVLPVYRADYSDRLARQTEIEALLARRGYKLLRVKKVGASPSLSHLEQIDTIGIHGDLNDCDYLVVPSEAVEQVRACLLRVVTPE